MHQSFLYFCKKCLTQRYLFFIVKVCFILLHSKKLINSKTTNLRQPMSKSCVAIRVNASANTPNLCVRLAVACGITRASTCVKHKMHNCALHRTEVSFIAKEDSYRIEHLNSPLVHAESHAIRLKAKQHSQPWNLIMNVAR